MLALDDPLWSALSHAYGSAADIPNLLACIDEFPPQRDRRADTWESLWSALCHQGDTYDASFAAVPHIVAALSHDPLRAVHDFHYFALPVAIELARLEDGRPVLSMLEGPYREALLQLSQISQHSASATWDEFGKRSAAAAFALSRGEVHRAKLLLGPDY